jgi:hypothetical protein
LYAQAVADCRQAFYRKCFTVNLKLLKRRSNHGTGKFF